MAITSFYLLNMFPRMRTLSSSPNNQHPTAKPNMFPQMRTLHHHLTINTQHLSQTCSLGCALFHHHPTINNQHSSQTCSLSCALHHHHPTIITQHLSQTCSLGCALYVITQQSTPITQAKHVPSDAHFTSSPNSQHPSPNSHERNSIDFSIKLTC